MNLKLFAALVISITASPLLYAQDDGRNSNSKSAIEAVSKFQRKRAQLSREYLTALEKLKSKHLARLETNRSNLLTALQDALETEAKNINLKEANKIDRLLKDHRVDRARLPDATDFNRQLSSLPDSMQGRWEGNWGTTGNLLEFDLSATDDREGGKISFKDRRILLLDRPHEYVELIPHHGKILVLGYSRKKGRHPYSSLPNHIGVVTRKKN